MAQALILLRHGLIEANRQGCWHGSTDSPLLPKGRRQAQQTAAHLVRQGELPVAVYSSPLQRCVATAQAVTDALNAHHAALARRARRQAQLHRLSFGRLGHNAPVSPARQIEPVLLEDLREYGIGAWEGLTFAELARAHQFHSRAIADMDYAPPEGESLRLVSQRMRQALQNLHQQHGPQERILIVGHGAALAVAMATLLNQDPSKWGDYHFDNCSLSELSLDGIPELRRFNYTGHL